MAKIMSHEEFVNNLESKYPGRYTILSKYTGNKNPITFKCNWCNSIVTLSSANNLKGGKCKECDKIKLSDFESLLKDTEYSIVDSSNFKDSKSKILIRHNICGHEYDCSYNNFQQKRACPKCANIKRASIIAPFVEDYLGGLLEKASDGKDYKWEEEYNHDNKEKLLITHLTCGRSYKVRPNDFQQGYRCPFCNNNDVSLPSKSRMWYFIDELLKDKGNLEYEFTDNNCKNIRVLPFDFKFNDTIIEYDGSQHFFANHSCITEEKLNITKENDKIKNEFVIGSEYNFIRLHYKLKEDNIREILQYVIDNENIPESIINKYSILVKQENIIYNYREYYDI